MSNIINNSILLIKTIVAVLPFFVICLAGSRVNLNRRFRNRQFFMPVIAVIYVIAAVILASLINNWLINLIDNIPVWLSMLSSLSFLPDAIRRGMHSFGIALTALFEQMNLRYWIFYISNFVIMLVFLVVKRFCLSIVGRIQEKSSVGTSIAGNFYNYFSDQDVWCIKDNIVPIRQIARAVFYTLIVLGCLFLVLSGGLYYQKILTTVFYPVFSVILVGEIFYFLNGQTRREYNKSIFGEEDVSNRIVNYSLLRKYLRSLFGDKLLAEQTRVNIPLTDGATNREILDRLSMDEDPKVVAFATYYEKLNSQGVKLDYNFLSSSLDLLQGKSILFNDPFYHDLIPYAFYPLNRMLLSQKKVLVISGRHAIEDDIRNWLYDGVASVTNIPFLWRIGILSQTEKALDIGIVTRSDIIRTDFHEKQEAFLEQVGFVVILEPSKLVTTAQIGLNLLIRKCKKDSDRKLVFCLCDKNCDGLVDAMSHILMENITEVSATDRHWGTSSYMCWESDGDYLHHRQLSNVSHYLGIGTELSFAALKNQVSKTFWYGGDAFPVTDMSWIARQYYYDLMKYAMLPTNQETMAECFVTMSDLWGAKVKKYNYFTVEDEAFNMFEILRDFSTRSTEQGFINVISSSYLLKDYMADNNAVFEADAKAMPYISADYARTRRNVILRLMILLGTGGLTEEEIKKEFSLVGLPDISIRKQLWLEMYLCLSSAKLAAALPLSYQEAADLASTSPISISDGIQKDLSAIIRIKEQYHFEKRKMQYVYYIEDVDFIDRFIGGLYAASYIFEDEQGNTYYLGAELKAHVFQKILPGQFFTYSGKYYEMLNLSSDGQVLVRRAADHIAGRVSYRQIRHYKISMVQTDRQIGSVKNIEGMRISRAHADFSVGTPGYYIMNRRDDFVNARKVLFEGEQSGIPAREYRNKEILKIEMPNENGSFTTEIKYTITLLLNEVFQTLFAENQPYIVAVSHSSIKRLDGEVEPLTYTLEMGENDSSDNTIYILEDSDLDLGLLVAVERNLMRIFNIIDDYLSWNKRSIALSLKFPEKLMPIGKETEDEDIDPNAEPVMQEDVKKESEGILKRTFKRIKQFLKKIRRKKDSDTTDSQDEEQGDNTVPETEIETNEEEAVQRGETADGES